MRRLSNSEKGQALPLALIILSIGALLVGAFLSYTSTNLIASRIRERIVEGQYAADAGVEDAIWNLLYGDFPTILTDPEDSISYTLDKSINGLTTNVTVTRKEPATASDNFESGGWSGGSGWLADWYYEGDASISASDQPYEGQYHLMLRANTGYIKRSVDLLGKANLHLQFWAKARSFETGEEAECLISSNGVDWTPVQTWVNGDDDNTYHYYDIDLSPYTMSSEFWIAFEANMSDTVDSFYVDNLDIRPVSPGAWLAPSEDFESGGWAGGTGWLYNWTYQGSSSVTPSQNPYEGSFHLEMKKDNSYVDRAADLSGQSDLRLQFWSKVRRFESGDEMYCLVSSNGSQWTTVKTWTSADSDDTYHFNDIDLSPYTMSSEFWIAFDSGMNANNDYFYVDDLNITGNGGGAGPESVTYEIESKAASATIWSTVVIEDSVITILSWQIE